MALARFEIKNDLGTDRMWLPELLQDNRDDDALCEWLEEAKVGEVLIVGGAFAHREITRIA